jgi:(2Fe-2S) ferredoxin
MDDAPTMRPYARHIFICTGADCDQDRKAEALYELLGSKLGDLARLRNPCRVKRGVTSCLGVCAGGPLLVVYPDGIWYHHVDEALLDRIIEEHLKNDRPVMSHVFHQLNENHNQAEDNFKND